jgi:ankyrin repeat protein
MFPDLPFTCQDQNLQTPLHLTILAGKLDAFKFLLSKGVILLFLLGRLDVQSVLLGKSCCPLQFWSGPVELGLQRCFLRLDDFP